MLMHKYGVGGGVKGWWWWKMQVDMSVGGVVGVKRVMVVVEKGWWWPKLHGVEQVVAVAKNTC